MSFKAFGGGPHDIVIDVECVGPRPDEMDPAVREYLAERAQNSAKWKGEQLGADEADERAMERLACELGLARVIAAGFHNVQENRTTILLEDTGERGVFVDGVSIERWPEAGILQRAWDIMTHRKAGRIVSYNGRGYDGPVIVVRSAQLGVQVRRHLSPYRFDLRQHCDLQDVLGFWGAVRTTFTLDYWTRVFGVGSPKADGISGKDIERLYRAGEMGTIASYLAGDLRSTSRLYVAFGRSGFLQQFQGGPGPDCFEPEDETEDLELPFDPLPGEPEYGRGLTEELDAAHQNELSLAHNVGHPAGKGPL